MKYEDLKCEFCNGHGEKEINRDGADVPQICSFCNGTGIDKDQIDKFFKENFTNHPCVNCGCSFDSHRHDGACPLLSPDLNGRIQLYDWLTTKYTAI